LSDAEELEWICKLEREERMVGESRTQLDRRLRQARTRLEQRLREERERQEEELRQAQGAERARLEQNLREHQEREEQRLTQAEAHLELRLREERERQEEELRQAQGAEHTRLEQNLREYQAREEQRLTQAEAHLELTLREMDNETRASLEQRARRELEEDKRVTRETVQSFMRSSRERLQREQHERKLIEEQGLTRSEQILRQELEEDKRVTRETVQSFMRSSRERLQREQHERKLIEEQGRTRSEQILRQELEEEDRPAREDLEQLEQKLREAREIPRWAIPEQHFFLDNSDCGSSSSPSRHSTPSSSPDAAGLQVRLMRNALNEAFNRFFNYNIAHRRGLVPGEERFSYLPDEWSKLNERELIRVYSALALVAGPDNPGLLIRYFEYYTTHELRRYNVFEMNDRDLVGRDADTRGGGDTAINLRVNLYTINLVRLGSLLLHEAMHTRDPGGLFGGTLYSHREGAAYALEYILGVRFRNTELRDYAQMQLNRGGTDFLSEARTYYETLMILYDIIDRGTSSRWAWLSPGLNSSRARELMTQYIFDAPANRSQDLQNILSWVETDLRNDRPAYRLVTYAP
jgi:hypothetical protein